MGLFNKNTKKETIVVEGMKCMHCAARVKDALSAHKVKADVNLESKLVTISYNESKITLEEIKRIVEETGFKCI